VAKSTITAFERGSILEVTSSSGDIEISGNAREDLEVEGASVSVEPGRIRVGGSSGSIAVRAPAGVDVIAGTSSGDVVLRGSLGDARVTTASGDIEVARVTRLDARTASGKVRVEDCAGECRSRSESGSLKVGRAGAVDLSTASGNVDASSVGQGSVWTASGNVTVGLTEAGDVRAETHSGSIKVRVPKGSRPDARLEASGTIRCDCEVGSDFRLELRAGSGNITVTEP
jgi:DUF4097 and DUF4098 domain-containing protein YvlB